MIRLAPRMAAATVALTRGVSLHLDAPTPDAWRAAREDGQLRVMARRAHDPEATDDLPMIEALLEHFVVGWEGVEDEAGAPAPFSLAAWRAAVDLDPRLAHHARMRLAEHIAPAIEALSEGNGSPTSSHGAAAGASGTAPTAPSQPNGAARPAPATAAPSPAARTSTP